MFNSLRNPNFSKNLGLSSGNEKQYNNDVIKTNGESVKVTFNEKDGKITTTSGDVSVERNTGTISTFKGNVTIGGMEKGTVTNFTGTVTIKGDVKRGSISAESVTIGGDIIKDKARISSKRSIIVKGDNHGTLSVPNDGRIDINGANYGYLSVGSGGSVNFNNTEILFSKDVANIRIPVFISRKFKTVEITVDGKNLKCYLAGKEKSLKNEEYVKVGDFSIRSGKVGIVGKFGPFNIMIEPGKLSVSNNPTYGKALFTYDSVKKKIVW